MVTSSATQQGPQCPQGDSWHSGTPATERREASGGDERPDARQAAQLRWDVCAGHPSSQQSQHGASHNCAAPLHKDHFNPAHVFADEAVQQQITSPSKAPGEDAKRSRTPTALSSLSAAPQKPKSQQHSRHHEGSRVGSAVPSCIFTVEIPLSRQDQLSRNASVYLSLPKPSQEGA